MPLQKVKDFQAVRKIAPKTIEKSEIENAIRSAQYALDVQLHDLRTEFLAREGKIRPDFLDRVAEITA